MLLLLQLLSTAAAAATGTSLFVDDDYGDDVMREREYTDVEQPLDARLEFQFY